MMKQYSSEVVIPRDIVEQVQKDQISYCHEYRASFLTKKMQQKMMDELDKQLDSILQALSLK